MKAKMRAFCGCRVVVAGLFLLAVILPAAGCATSPLESYRASLQNSGGVRFNWQNWRIEHNLFNGRYQQTEKEDWEDD